MLIKQKELQLNKESFQIYRKFQEQTLEQFLEFQFLERLQVHYHKKDQLQVRFLLMLVGLK
jgi:hypothetical protein